MVLRIYLGVTKTLPCHVAAEFWLCVRRQILSKLRYCSSSYLEFGTSNYIWRNEKSEV